MIEPQLETVSRTVSVSVTAPVSGQFDSVHALERAILEATRVTGRLSACAAQAGPLYAQAFAAGPEAWLGVHRQRFPAQRWRALCWLTPFGEVPPARARGPRQGFGPLPHPLPGLLAA